MILLDILLSWFRDIEQPLHFVLVTNIKESIVVEQIFPSKVFEAAR